MKTSRDKTETCWLCGVSEVYTKLRDDSLFTRTGKLFRMQFKCEDSDKCNEHIRTSLIRAGVVPHESSAPKKR